MKAGLALFLAFVLLTSLAGCGPLVAPPALGHYHGADPDVAFDITNGEIENFTITASAGNIQGFYYACSVSVNGTIPIKSDGSFSRQVASGISISGNIDGTAVRGLFTDDLCNAKPIDDSPKEQEVQISVDWSASLNGQ
jgi:predicted small lipoprotein YifL